MPDDKAQAAIREVVIDTLVKLTGNTEVTSMPDSASLADCGLDSLAVLEFVSLLEGRFNIEFDEALFTSTNFHTIGQTVSVLCQVTGAQAR
jgi:acyl carrier protein